MEEPKYDPKHFKDGEWYCEAVMGIEEVRILHQTITEYLDIMEEVPEANEAYLNHIQSKMFAMIAEFNLEL